MSSTKAAQASHKLPCGASLNVGPWAELADPPSQMFHSLSIVIPQRFHGKDADYLPKLLTCTRAKDDAHTLDRLIDEMEAGVSPAYCVKLPLQMFGSIVTAEMLLEKWDNGQTKIYLANTSSMGGEIGLAVGRYRPVNYGRGGGIAGIKATVLNAMDGIREKYLSVKADKAKVHHYRISCSNITDSMEHLRMASAYSSDPNSTTVIQHELYVMTHDGLCPTCVNVLSEVSNDSWGFTMRPAVKLGAPSTHKRGAALP